MSKVPKLLAESLFGLMLLMGAGGGIYLNNQAAVQQAQSNEYAQAVAADSSTSMAVKIAMVMGHYYESSNRHIGTPYVDKVGKGQPLTVCNGVTGAGVTAGKYYSPRDCYELERARYIQTEAAVAPMLRYWSSYDPFVQATFIDFGWNKPLASFKTSTMRAKANAGDLLGACAENPRWNKGTVQGVQVVLPGLQIRGDSNGELCAEWRVPS
ncbi:glycoside hydrolase family protein [Comamonas sp. 4034]|uniref:lysozyme n=1 Tax=Comamonas sp. 4034 TaxID=3156455 RepID=UPI003D241026